LADSLTYASLVSNVISAPIVSSIFSILATSFLGYQKRQAKLYLSFMPLTEV